VDYVQPDLKLKAFVQTLPTGIDRTDADLSSAKAGDDTRVSNVIVAAMIGVRRYGYYQKPVLNAEVLTGILRGKNEQNMK
jgi:hypothetical protein